MKHFFYQCNIKLTYPSTNRILLVEAHSSLASLHHIIQLAFELDNDKDYRFYEGQVSHTSCPVFPVFPANSPIKPLSSSLSLASLSMKTNTVLSYLYDSQNTFLFHIIIEKLRCANTSSTSPRLLQNPEEIHISSSQRDQQIFSHMFRDEFY